MTFLSRSVFPNVSGSLSDFAVSFPYLSASHVHVYTRNPTTQVLTEISPSGFSWSSDSLIHTVTPPPAGVALEVWRLTPKDHLLARLSGGSVIRSADENEMATQMLYIVQEMDDAETDLSLRALQVPANEVAPPFPSLLGKVGKLLVVASASVLAWVSPVEAGLLAKGDPGGNVMSTSSFAALPGIAVPVGTDRIRTSEYRAGSGKGGAWYKAFPQGSSGADTSYAAAHPGWAVLTSNSRLFILDDEQPKILFEMFGAYGDSDRGTIVTATDDYPQWLVAKDFLQTHKRTHGNAYYKSVPALHFGRYDYRFSLALDLTEGVYSLVGAGPSAIGFGGNTGFVMDAGQCGIIFQSWDTIGVQGSTTNTAKGSAYSFVQDIDVYSRGGTVDAEQHGFLLKAPANLSRCGAHDFGGCCFRIAADVLFAGNANCGRMTDCWATGAGDSGLRVSGGDSNAWEIRGFNAFNNARAGIYESSFLGNHYHGGHTAGNGVTSGGPAWAAAGTRASAGVTFSGHYYTCIEGQEVGASTNAPTGAATSNTWWSYVGDGSATSVFPAWVSGNRYVFGGAVVLTGASNKSGVFGMYMESDQLSGRGSAQRALAVVGGFAGFSGPSLNAHDGRLWTPGLGLSQNNGDGVELTATQIQTGPNCYFERIDSEQLRLRGPLGISVSLVRNGSAHQHTYSISLPMGTILGSAGNGGFVTAAAAMPSTGTYTQGAFVHNTAPAVAGGKVLLGWKRLTTGSAHVAGTDWTTVYGTTT